MLRALLLATFLFLISPSLMAMNCGKYNVNKGQKQYEILSHCGSPESKSAYQVIAGKQVPIKSGEKVKGIAYDEWIYNFHGQNKHYTLIFQNKRLIAVHSQ